jgi:hypothetical protein
MPRYVEAYELLCSRDAAVLSFPAFLKELTSQSDHLGE